MWTKKEKFKKKKHLASVIHRVIEMEMKTNKQKFNRFGFREEFHI